MVHLRKFIVLIFVLIGAMTLPAVPARAAPQGCPFVKIGKHRYYIDPATGLAAKNQFVTIGKDKYFFDGKGRMVTGKKRINGEKYWFRKNGKLNRKKLYFGMPIGTHKSAKTLTPKMIVRRAEKIIRYIRKNKKYKYGDSQAYPPCTDKRISCDRLASSVLYSLGLTSQPKTGGYKLANRFLEWLPKAGFKEYHDIRYMKKGSIVWVNNIKVGHIFIVADWDGKVLKRYDTGNDRRIMRMKQPIRTKGFPYPKENIRIYNPG